MKGIGADKPVGGDYDFYVFFAHHYHWTIEQVNAHPLDFLEELRARYNAEARYLMNEVHQRA